MKKFIYVISFLFVGSLAANAYVDSQYMTTEQFLTNSGFSKDTAKNVSFSKQDPYTLNDKTDKRTIYQKIYNYIDPCSGASRAYPDHDVNPDSNWQDL